MRVLQINSWNVICHNRTMIEDVSSLSLSRSIYIHALYMWIFLMGNFLSTLSIYIYIYIYVDIFMVIFNSRCIALTIDLPGCHGWTLRFPQPRINCVIKAKTCRHSDAPLQLRTKASWDTSDTARLPAGIRCRGLGGNRVVKNPSFGYST